MTEEAENALRVGSSLLAERCLSLPEGMESDAGRVDAGAGELVAHGFEAQAHAVLGVRPEGMQVFVKAAVGGGDGELVADDVIGDDGDDAPGDGVLAPGFEGVGVDLLDAGGVVIVGATGEGGVASRVVDLGGDGGEASGGRRSIQPVGYALAEGGSGHWNNYLRMVMWQYQDRSTIEDKEIVEQMFADFKSTNGVFLGEEGIIEPLKALKMVIRCDQKSSFGSFGTIKDVINLINFNIKTLDSAIISDQMKSGLTG